MTETEIIGLIALSVGYTNGVMLGWVLLRKPQLGEQA